MIRRNPTRIELKLEDLQDYDNVRQAQEARREELHALANAKANGTKASSATSGEQALLERNERIGFCRVPHPHLKPVVTSRPQPPIPYSFTMIIIDAKERCSYQNWYRNFDDLIDESVVIQIPEDVLEYLRGDGIVLPQEAVIERTPEWQSNTDSDIDWDASQVDTHEVKQPTFPHFSKQLSNAINELGGAVFIKLNWSAPFDAAWILADKTLKCTSLEDIYLLLKSSERIDSDISYEFKSPQTVNKYVIVLKRWNDVDPGSEYRCFVYRNELVAISQRDIRRSYPYITDAKFDIIEDIKQFYKEKLKDNFHLSDYVFDVTWKKKEEVDIMDVSPLDQTTNPLLFRWEEFERLTNSSMASENIPEFRYLAENPGHQPVYYGLPLDFNPRFVEENVSLNGIVSIGYMQSVADFLSHRIRNNYDSTL